MVTQLELKSAIDESVKKRCSDEEIEQLTNLLAQAYASVTRTLRHFGLQELLPLHAPDKIRDNYWSDLAKTIRMSYKERDPDIHYDTPVSYDMNIGGTALSMLKEGDHTLFLAVAIHALGVMALRDLFDENLRCYYHRYGQDSQEASEELLDDWKHATQRFLRVETQLAGNEMEGSEAKEVFADVVEMLSDMQAMLSTPNTLQAEVDDLKETAIQWANYGGYLLADRLVALHGPDVADAMKRYLEHPATEPGFDYTDEAETNRILAFVAVQEANRANPNHLGPFR